MSLATVYSTAQYGLADIATLSGLYGASVSYAASSTTAQVPDHLGCTVGLGITDPMKTVSMSGIIKTKGTGLAVNIGSTIALAESANNSRTKNSEGLGSGIVLATASLIIITAHNISPTANGFEAGDANGVYYPFIPTGTSYTLT